MMINWPYQLNDKYKRVIEGFHLLDAFITDLQEVCEKWEPGVNHE